MPAGAILPVIVLWLDSAYKLFQRERLFHKLFRTSNIIYIGPLLMVHAFPTLTGFHLFQYVLFLATGRGTSARAANYLKALYSSLGVWGIGALKSRGWTVDSPPMLLPSWIGGNPAKSIIIVYLSLLWMSPLVQNFRRNNVVVQNASYGVQTALPLVRGLSLAVVLPAVVAYASLSPVYYGTHQIPVLRWLRFGLVTSMEITGLANYLWFGKVARDVYGQDGLWLAGVTALLSVFIAIMAWGGGDYGSVVNNWLEVAEFVWDFYLMVSPLIFTLFSLAAYGAFDWIGPLPPPSRVISGDSET
ncbi:hypothetical protein DFP73DRAFT_237244 [Morchella snyderi]|nr:hypothetical protein DFP73DRAFT_237244 [Morchella snyderi]